AVATVLVVDVLLDALQLQLAVDEVSRREAALFSVRVADLEIAGSKPVRLRIADARDAVVVPQDAVVACRDDEGYGDIYVVLSELDVLAVEVELSVLMLPGTIERLVRAGIETPRDAERGLLARGLRKKHVAVGILETDGTVRERDVRGELAGREHDLHVPPLHFECRCRLRGFHDHQALRELEVRIVDRGHAHSA